MNCNAYNLLQSIFLAANFLHTYIHIVLNTYGPIKVIYGVQGPATFQRHRQNEFNSQKTFSEYSEFFPDSERTQTVYFLLLSDILNVSSCWMFLKI